MKFKQENNSGFTLIEMLVVVAFIAILSGAILTSVSGQRDKARVAGALAELSGTLQPVLACKSDGYNVRTSAGDICSASGYGVWPTSDGLTLSLSHANDSNWYFSGTVGGSTICCNNYSSKCAISESCAANTSL